MELNDVYDAERRLTGRVHRRGTRWRAGDYGLIVCVWVYDGRGKVLLTCRAPEKSFAGTWENSGGAAQHGETSLQAVTRELYEETGIQAAPEAFELLDSRRDRDAFLDFYCLKNDTPIEQIVLQQGETVDARWVSFEEVHRMIEQKQICKVISRQFLHQEQQLLDRQDPEFRK